MVGPRRFDWPADGTGPHGGGGPVRLGPVGDRDLARDRPFTATGPDREAPAGPETLIAEVGPALAGA